MSGVRQRLLAIGLGLACAAALVAAWRFRTGGETLPAGADPRSARVDRNTYLRSSNRWLYHPPSGPPYALRGNLREPPLIATDALGLRGAPLPVKKKHPRVLFLGDSVTFGFGLPEGAPFTELLAKQLEGRAEIANAAVIGYELADSVAQLERIGPEVRADLVVLPFFWNDLDDSRALDASPADPHTRAPSVEELPEGRYTGTADLLRIAEQSGLSGDRFLTFLKKQQKGDRWLPLGIGPFARARWDWAAALVEKAKSAAKANGGTLIMLSYGSPDDALHRRLVRCCGSAGVSLYCMPEGFKLDAPRRRLEWDPHPNAYAHQELAAIVRRVLAATSIGTEPGVEPAQPLAATPALEFTWNAAVEEWAAKLAPRVVTAPADAAENMHQIVAGIEDDKGTLGGAATVLLRAKAAPRGVAVALALERPTPGETRRTIEASVNGGAPQAIVVTKERSTAHLAVPPRIGSAVEQDPRGFVEVVLVDPAVARAEPSKRREHLGVRIYSLAVE